MAGPATATDLSNRSLRTLTVKQLSVGAILLEDAWSVITAKLPTSVERVEADEAFRALVVQVQCAMVLRVLNNPDGKFEESSDDYSYRRDQAVSTGMLYLSDAEESLLGAGDGGSEGAWTIKPAGITPGRGYWASTDVWVPLI